MNFQLKRPFTIVVLFFVVFTNSSCHHQELSELDFLAGTWKIKDQEQYEYWEKRKDVMVGHAYSLKGDKKIINETLRIKKEGRHLIYIAKVLDQNEGKPIEFKLNKLADSSFSFENSEHDFPKKIQYIWVSKNELMVNLFGDDNKKITYNLLKQD